MYNKTRTSTNFLEEFRRRADFFKQAKFDLDGAIRKLKFPDNIKKMELKIRNLIKCRDARPVPDENDPVVKEIAKLTKERVTALWNLASEYIRHGQRFCSLSPLSESDPSIAWLVYTLYYAIQVDYDLLQNGRPLMAFDRHISEKGFKYFSSSPILYRARLGAETLNKPYCGANISMPPRNKATAGRCNPVGIPYLYLATDIMTAIAEVRPYVGQFVSIGHFQLDVKNKHVILLPLKKINRLLGKGVPLPIHDWSCLSDILSTEFAKPYSMEDAHIGYIATQFVAETLRSFNLIDGFTYESSQTLNGINVVLFNAEKVVFKNHS